MSEYDDNITSHTEGGVTTVTFENISADGLTFHAFYSKQPTEKEDEEKRGSTS